MASKSKPVSGPKSPSKRSKAKPRAKVTTPEPVSQRAYARHRKISQASVQTAIAAGRLSASLVEVKGVKKISSLEAADAEWADKTGPTPEQRKDDTAAERLKPDEEVNFPEARRRKAIEDLKVARIQASHHELDLAERRGDLLSATKVHADVVEDYLHVRTKMLGVPARCRQRIQNLSGADVKVIDGLIREALEELAEGQ